MRVLAVNAGSSSVKLSVLDDDDDERWATSLERPEPADLGRVIGHCLVDAPAFDAVGHRVVHGGAEHEAPLVLDDRADTALAALAELAPLHNPPALALILELRRLVAAVPHVACFDTSFHVSMPRRAATYALPKRWRDDWGIRRYGFHGLSHAWASRRAAALLGRRVEEIGTISSHLGAGASLCAVRGGRSVDTTMGFTPLEGLVMATRSGSVDPGAIVWAVRHGGLSADEIESDLERNAGLLGLSDRSGDLREVIAGADGGDGDCALAYAVYVYRIQTAAGAMAVALGHLDALVFTGGAGEGSARLRVDVCRGLGALGVPALGDGRSRDGGTGGTGIDRILTPPGAAPAVLVVRAREDLEIARQVRWVLGA